MAIKCTNIYHSKDLQYKSKRVFLARKYTIWQPWSLAGFIVLSFDQAKTISQPGNTRWDGMTFLSDNLIALDHFLLSFFQGWFANRKTRRVTKAARRGNAPLYISAAKTENCIHVIRPDFFSWNRTHFYLWNHLLQLKQSDLCIRHVFSTYLLYNFTRWPNVTM
jgi:hypothetical protein